MSAKNIEQTEKMLKNNIVIPNIEIVKMAIGNMRYNVAFSIYAYLKKSHEEDDELKKYIKRNAKIILSMLLDNHMTNSIIEFLSWDILSKNALTELLDKCSDTHDTVLTAYTTQAISRLGQTATSFSL